MVSGNIQIREQLLSFLLQNVDSLTNVVEEQQKKIAELQKKIAELSPSQDSQTA